MPNSLEEIRKRLKEFEINSSTSRNKADSAESIAQAKISREEKTRSTLTHSFLYGFFFLLFCGFIFTKWYNSAAVDWILKLHQAGLDDAAGAIKLLELDKVLSVIIGALGTSLGFIIGYYFKDKK
ncbi:MULTISPECIES: hypothetical protein [Enterobacteriaceae]|uniref:hypothetical protein n=1 Tax=Enterobacteriaceae TaxID=543 RepID=UPI000B7E5BCD|nr:MULTISPECIES: hypothetical protein [Enterobacteriaceae]MBJ8683561.1 hypothetical protein [Citrobacter freundii]HBV7788735.1 hypothetical protein [Escherichia coli]HEM8504451.1 hypothetical protein [Citrobacter koseri]HEM8571049.1 hypothetical protein [Citrobacter koseri]